MFINPFFPAPRCKFGYLGYVLASAQNIDKYQAPNDCSLHGNVIDRQ